MRRILGKRANQSSIVLGLILILAALLRFIGTYPGYPPIHTDEGITHSQGIAMILERSLVPKQGYGQPFAYPIVVPFINAIFYLVLFIPVSTVFNIFIHIQDILLALNQSSFAEQLSLVFNVYVLGANKINVVFWGRYITALFGIGVVFLSYLLSERLLKSKRIGLLSALFVAINFRQVLNSHIGIPDIYNAFFLLISLLAILRLWDKQTLERYLLAGVGIAIYFSTKFQLFTIPSLVLVLLFVSLKKKTWSGRLRFFVGREILLMALLTISIALILNIFHILHWDETAKQVGQSVGKYRYGQNELDLYPLSYLYHIGIGPLMSWVIGSGILLGLVFNPRPTLFLLATAVPFFAFFVYMTGGGFYTRNFVTITPVLLILAAYGFEKLFVLSRKRFFLAGVIAGIFLVFLSWESLRNSIIVPLEYTKEWNYKLTQEWIGKTIPDGARVAVNPNVPVPVRDVKLIKIDSPTGYFLAELQDLGAEWVVVNLDYVNNVTYWWMVQGKFWNKPDVLLLNTPVGKMVQELRGYVVYEALNPWQAPDTNFLVVKIPEKISFPGGKTIYRNGFDSMGNWTVSNDKFGDTSNFYWDPDNGYKSPGSLKIKSLGTPVYSTRFTSGLIPIEGEKLYRIRAFMRASKMIEWENREGFLGVDIFDGGGSLVTTVLSSRLFGQDGWVTKEIMVQVPKEGATLQLFFQTEGNNTSSFWLDDVEVWESSERCCSKDAPYMKSKLKLEDHLFLNSNAGF
ncbi:MAG: phospholipid carrier-dependent glycosyltransferase [bacterium]|nr:phospholipid carrier-dependent glycosyltransferase [bacterium]